MQFEIYWDDLSESAKEHLSSIVGEDNVFIYETSPIAVVELEPESNEEDNSQDYDDYMDSSLDDIDLED